MPIYEYACFDCKKAVSVLVRRPSSAGTVRCPECGGGNVRRLISGFAFHQSLQSKLEQLDPKYDRMIDAANPDLSFDNLVKRYGLDKPVKRSVEE
jgi:putative FmdB family regulatory protein